MLLIPGASPTRTSLSYPFGRRPFLDPTHPASSRVAHPVVFSAISCGGNFINVCNGLPGTVAGTVTKNNYQTGPMSFAADAAGTITFPGVAYSNTDPFTLGAIMYATSFAYAQSFAPAICNDGVGTAGSALSIRQTTGLLSLTKVGSGHNDSSFALKTNTPYFAAASSAGGATTIDFVLLNLLTGQLLYETKAATASPWANFTNNYSVLNSGGSSRPFENGGVAAVMCSRVRCYLFDLIQWAKDPWSFWYDSTGIFDFIVGTATTATDVQHRLALLKVGM